MGHATRAWSVPASPEDGCLQVSGGKGALMDSPIFLCARRDLDAGQFWTGKLAHLMLWDQALEQSNVATLFQTYAASEHTFLPTECCRWPGNSVFWEAGGIQLILQYLVQQVTSNVACGMSSNIDLWNTQRHAYMQLCPSRELVEVLRDCRPLQACSASDLTPSQAVQNF